MSESVARQVLATRDGATLGGEERAVTVILTDHEGYATVSEVLTPPEIVRMLNAYFGEMGRLVEEHEGCTVGYLGDGILAVFSAPLTVERHAELAVRCAEAMRARLVELNREWEQSGFARMWQAKGVSTLRMRVGVHSGSVVAGNIGSASRVTYTMIGDTVNVAARLEQLNKETRTEILFSAQTFALLPAELQARARACGTRHVKGRVQDVAVYTV
jgi:adenylate cyclase